MPGHSSEPTPSITTGPGRPRATLTCGTTRLQPLLPGNWDRAEQTYRKALELKPDLKRAWVNLGLTLAQLGRPEESFDAFTKAVPPAQAHCNLGFALAARGKTADAIHEYRKALELSPDLTVARAALVKLDAPRPAKKVAAKPDDKLTKPAQKPEPVAKTEPIELPE